MISPVDNYIKQYADAGSDIITFHPEATNNTAHTISLIRKAKKGRGFLKPKSNINLIEKYLNELI